MAWCSTNCFLYYTDNLLFPSVSPLLCLTLVASSPTPLCKSSPLFPANINPAGLYQCFVSLSVLPWLPLSSFSFTVHSKSELWSSHDLSDSGPEAWSNRLVCVCVCGPLLQKHPRSCQSLCVWSKNNYLMGLWCLDLIHCVTNVSQQRLQT